MAKKIKKKTKRSLAKRILITKTGKLKRACAYTSHLKRNKTRKQKRKLRKCRFISSSDLKREKRLIVK